MPKKPSNSSMGRGSPWPLYPIAFSAYPFLALLSSNAGPVEPAAGLRSLLASALFGTLLFSSSGSSSGSRTASPFWHSCAWPLMFEIPAEEAWDIDEELDFAIAEFLMARQQGK